VTGSPRLGDSAVASLQCADGVMGYRKLAQSGTHRRRRLGASFSSGASVSRPNSATLARAESDGAPFVRSAECRLWVEQGLRELPDGNSRGSGTDEVGAN